MNGAFDPVGKMLTKLKSRENLKLYFIFILFIYCLGIEERDSVPYSFYVPEFWSKKNLKSQIVKQNLFFEASVIGGTALYTLQISNRLTPDDDCPALKIP